METMIKEKIGAESHERGKKQSFMAKKLKRRILVGKRTTPCVSTTPPPAWRRHFSSPNHINNNNQEFLNFPWLSSSTFVSARNLCATLWEIEPHKPHFSTVPKTKKLSCSRSRYQNTRIKGLITNDQAATEDSSRRCTSEWPIDQMNGFSLRPVGLAGDGSSLQIAPYKPEIMRTNSLNLRGRRTTSTELVRVLNRIWSLEEQHSSNLSLVHALKVELDQYRARELVSRQEKQSDNKKIANLMKKISEERLELQDERELRHHLESLHRKLTRELSRTESSLSNALEELERGRKARILLEKLCDEFAKGITDYEQEVRSLKHKGEMDLVGRENPDRLNLHISEAWLDERMQMNLEKSQNSPADVTIVDKLGLDIETFLEAKQFIASRKHGGASRKEIKENCSRRYSSESFPLTSAISGPENAAEEEEISETGFQQIANNDAEDGTLAQNPNLLELCEAFGDGLQLEIRCKQTVSKRLNSNHLIGNLIENSFFSSEGTKIHPEISPIQHSVSKLTNHDLENSESSSKRSRGLKESTLMSKLLEARLEGRNLNSRSKSSI